MKLKAITIAAVLATSTALAQEQQAGNDASVNTEETFQALLEQCDVTDILVMRGKLRVQIPRITETAAAKASALMKQGLVQCGEGDEEGAIATMNQALEIAAQGATENFGTQGTVAATQATQEAAAEAEEAAAPDLGAKPWWQFW
ncbi:MAG: hypothetical protein AAF198_00640 [Pseudomonadota bacterium]